ncbi:MAG: hypothetical protein ACXVAN_17390 [Polyangia bacterium]
MRTLLLALVCAAACHSASLPGGGGDGGAADLARPGDGGRVCAVLCTMGFTCCDGACVNLRNDIRNCGVCGHVCSAPDDFCDGSSCVAPPCSPACGAGMLCCDVPGPGPSRGPMCTTPTVDGTCPPGCPLCL